jgi:hypothetical protein
MRCNKTLHVSARHLGYVDLMRALLVAVAMMVMTAIFTSGCEVDPGCVDQTGKPAYCESDCCKVCTNSQPCGDSCISTTQACNVGPGCACSPAE